MTGDSRELLTVLDRVSRSTTNRDMLTICHALRDRLIAERTRDTVARIDAASREVRAMTEELAKLPKLSRVEAPELTRPERAGQALKSAMERAEDKRKAPRGKAKRVISRQKARKADK